MLYFCATHHRAARCEWCHMVLRLTELSSACTASVATYGLGGSLEKESLQASIRAKAAVQTAELEQEIDEAREDSNYDKIDKLRGLDICVTTSAHTNEHALALLKAFNFPFRG